MDAALDLLGLGQPCQINIVRTMEKMKTERERDWREGREETGRVGSVFSY